jgi:mannose-6-phosphate isomerase-like protein (cupin superfamily)
MDPRFQDVFSSPENSIFKVVFFPDRIYHEQYLNATRSPRYRYNVREVRGKLDITVLKGEIFLDGQFLTNFVRLEYRSSRLVEVARQRGRLQGRDVLAWMRLSPTNGPAAEAQVKLHLCRWTDAFQVELWETLEAPGNTRHDFTVLDQMGRGAPITRVAAFGPALRDLPALRRVEVAFREAERTEPSGFRIGDPKWDNNYISTHQEPRSPKPSDDAQNTIQDGNYLLDFQRGYFVDATNVAPVRYLNAMMDGDNPDRKDGNVIEMRWLLQRELGASVIFFHEVTIPAGTVEGTHWHIGSEELYYIVSGNGVAYMGENDDPAIAALPTVERDIFGLGKRNCKQIPVRAGHVIYTKSGGIHGIRNDGAEPLKFVAFLYNSV